MTLEEFYTLGLFEKIQALQLGRLIAKRKTAHFCIYLYTLNDFFVEVLYSKAEHELNGFIPFKDLQRLDPYLQQISLPAIL
jgi:hypothetical protein